MHWSCILPEIGQHINWRKLFCLYILSPFNSSTILSESNIKDVIVRVSHYTLPYYALHKTRRRMICSHPVIHLQPNFTMHCHLVWKEPGPWWYRANIQKCCRGTCFARFIHSQCAERLSNLLQFKPQCGLQSITVDFDVPQNEFQRRPSASTCTTTISLPTSYDSFTAFAIRRVC